MELKRLLGVLGSVKVAGAACDFDWLTAPVCHLSLALGMVSRLRTLSDTYTVFTMEHPAYLAYLGTRDCTYTLKASSEDVEGQWVEDRLIRAMADTERNERPRSAMLADLGRTPAHARAAYLHAIGRCP